MSTTTSLPTHKQNLVDRVKNASSTYVADYGFIPVDKLGVPPMGKARTAIEFTVECAGFNLLIASLLKGEDASSTEGLKAMIDAIKTGDEAIDAFKQSTAALSAAVENVAEEHLADSVTMPWGSTVTLYDAVSMACGHMVYHDGQINYIQSLFGDGEMHWTAD